MGLRFLHKENRRTVMAQDVRDIGKDLTDTIAYIGQIM